MSEEGASTASGTFVVDLPVFSGPFRLLADLILEQKVDVCDVAVARVTDRFLEHAADAESWSLEEATWFLAVCAMLLELKVGRLMPRHELVDEDDVAGGSPDLAYARSIELAAFRSISGELALRLEDEENFFTRDIGPGEEFAHLYPDVMANVDASRLAEMAAALLRPPPVLDLSHVTPVRYTVDEAMQAVEERLGVVGQAPFHELVSDCEDRIHVVVRFLALLELYREGKVEVSQAETFGELRVTWRSGGSR